MGYVEDETREKQRADLRELGGTLREFAELEARRRNWGPAQRRLGLAMSAWQFFVIRRRHGRFLAKERARLRALGVEPPLRDVRNDKARCIHQKYSHLYQRHGPEEVGASCIYFLDPHRTKINATVSSPSPLEIPPI